MYRMFALAVTVLLLAGGCAGTEKLTRRSEQKLAGGDAMRAWRLAVRALEKEPGHPQARAAATAAGASIGQDWERRIRALAGTDSVRAAEEALAYVRFRMEAAAYATIPTGIMWGAEEAALRNTAARILYSDARAAMQSQRPKRAHGHFVDAQRFVPGYRDAAMLEDRMMRKATTRVAMVPFRGPQSLSAQLTEAWRRDLGAALLEGARYSRMLPAAAVDRTMTVSQLSHASREEALKLGRGAGADRVVWGTIGGIETSTRVEWFRDTIARRVRVPGPDGQAITRWIEVPIEVVARVRDVSVGLDYELIATGDGTTLAQRNDDRSASVRAVWTSFRPEGDLASYALVSETVRSANPALARKAEARWQAVCGSATLSEVLEARRSTDRRRPDRAQTLARLAAGAAFVFLEEMPSADDLAVAALTPFASVREDLVRIDAVDDVDLGAGTAAVGER